MKNQSTYEELIVSFQQKCSEFGFQTDPTTVTMDYELATLHAVTTTIGQQETSTDVFITSRKTQGEKSIEWAYCNAIAKQMM